MINFEDREKKMPNEFKKLAKDLTDKGFITTSMDNLVTRSMTGSLN